MQYILKEIIKRSKVPVEDSVANLLSLGKPKLSHDKNEDFDEDNDMTMKLMNTISFTGSSLGLTLTVPVSSDAQNTGNRSQYHHQHHRHHLHHHRYHRMC